MTTLANLPLQQHTVDAQGWMQQARALHARRSTLLSLWAGRAGRRMQLLACWVDASGLTLLTLPLAAGVRQYPGLHELFPAADRLQRALRDLWGLRAIGADARPWLRHRAWGERDFPLLKKPSQMSSCAPVDDYAFIPVAGDGVHEIGVGPVHAGVIEPGQFRFSVVGEKVLKLEQRLGWCHRGLSARMQGAEPLSALRLAARCSGDSAAAYAWGYCSALEQLAGFTLPPRALAWRALLLERERLANHLGDLAAIVGDCGQGLLQGQFARLKEDLLRLNAVVFGARYPFDAIVPGGVAFDLDAAAIDLLQAQSVALGLALETLAVVCAEHGGLQDRLKTTGRVELELAQRLGLLGLAARSSGLPLDLRALPQAAPYAGLGFEPCLQDKGDVAARFNLRHQESMVSLRLCRSLLDVPAGPVHAPLPPLAAGHALAAVEGWRGPVLVALNLGDDGRIVDCHLHDPSWQNWPALEWAVIGDIVADFPLINKSFNLSYAGADG